MPQPAAIPQPQPAAAHDDDERRDRERQEAIDAYNARRVAEGKPPYDPERAARFVALDKEIAAYAAAIRREEERKRAQQEAPPPTPKARSATEIIEHARLSQKARQEREAAEREAQPKAQAPEPQPPAAAKREAQPKAQAHAPKEDIIASFPIIPATARAVVNEIASSALFSAIQGKDRKLVKDMPIPAMGETQMFFTGELLNQDDHDVFMQLVYFASAEPLGAYVTVSGHSLLKALGRKTGGTAHQQLDAEIKRLTHAGVEIKTQGYTYIGHLIHDAVKHEISGQWVYRLNEKLIPMYGASCYTLIDWEQRKRLKGKDLARWLQLEIARHALPFPVKVETLRERSGSQTKELWKFRQLLKAALETLKVEGHIAAWQIDENDLVHIDRGAALTTSQRRRLAPPPKR